MATPTTRTGLGITACLLASGLLGGCAVYGPVPAYDPYSGVAVVGPPVLGVAPYPGAIWIEGVWGWRGGRREWVPGRWEHGHGDGRGWDGRGGDGRGWNDRGRDGRGSGDRDDRGGWRGRGR